MQRLLTVTLLLSCLFLGSLVAAEQTPSPSNERILRHIQEELQSHYQNYSINLRIYDGVVTLTGIVDSEQDRQTILSHVRQLNGVKRVQDQLELRGTSHAMLSR